MSTPSLPPQRPAGWLLLLVVCLSVCGCEDTAPGDSVNSAEQAPGKAANSAAQTVWFRETARERGLDFVHVPGAERRYQFPEIMGAGGAAGDFDGDGDLDLYLVQSGDLQSGPDSALANCLYQNRGDGTFVEVGQAAGVADTGFGMGAAAGDVDGDGDLDLFVTNVGPNRLYLNRGDGSFERASDSGVEHPGWGTSATFLDFDDDGQLDLFVTNYIVWSPETDLVCRTVGDRRDYCQPNEYGAPGPDLLYRGRGDGSFEDVTEAAGIASFLGNGLGVVADDFDLDGDTDIYVANDMVANALWINLGDGRFEERGLLSGSAFNADGEAEASMGVAAFDVEGDGDSDLFMTHWWGQKNTFYENRGLGVFSDRTAFTGLAVPSIPFTGFGVGFHDFDHDGHEDVYVANGRVTYITPLVDRDAPYVELNQLFRGLGQRRFEELRPRGGTERELLGSSRAAIFGDYDGDGDIDIAVTQNGQRLHFLENIAPKSGHWILIDVRDESGAVPSGARVRVRAGERTWWRTLQPAYGYASSNDPRLHVGLGAAERVDQVQVVLADGSTQSFGPLEADREHRLQLAADER